MYSLPVIHQYRLGNALQFAWVFQVLAILAYLVYWAISPRPTILIDILDERIFGAFFFGFIVGVIEEYVLRRGFRKMSFAKALIFKTLSFASLIAIALPVFRGISQYIGFAEKGALGWFQQEILSNPIHTLQVFSFYALITMLSLVVVQTIRYVGKGRLLSFLTGKYEHPAWEHNILMFVDLKASTTIADSLSSAQYSALIKDYIADLSEPIYQHAGKVYQYVGDEVIVYWPLSQNTHKNTRPLDCFVGMLKIIASRKSYYLNKYGVAPEFKGGLHGGPMIVTEVGAMKKEIAFHGTVVNTTSRIQEKCNELDTNFLVSEYVLQHAELAPRYEAFSQGSFWLKGKIEPLSLFTVEQTRKK